MPEAPLSLSLQLFFSHPVLYQNPSIFLSPLPCGVTTLTVRLLITAVAFLVLCDLLSPAKKPATNHLLYLLHSWGHMSSVFQLLPKGTTPPSYTFPTLTHLGSPYFPAKLLLRLSLGYFCMLALLNFFELETVPDSWLLSPSLLNVPGKEHKKPCVPRYYERDFKVLKEHQIISLIPCFITNCKAPQSC